MAASGFDLSQEMSDEEMVALMERLRGRQELDDETMQLVRRIHERDDQIYQRASVEMNIPDPEDIKQWGRVYESKEDGLTRHGWRIVGSFYTTALSDVRAGIWAPTTGSSERVNRNFHVNTWSSIAINDFNPGQLRSSLAIYVTQMRKLSHPSIIDYYDHFFVDPDLKKKHSTNSAKPGHLKLIVITEYPDAGNLEWEILRYARRRERPVDQVILEDDCRRYTEGILQAMDHAHKHNITFTSTALTPTRISLKFQPDGRKKALLNLYGKHTSISDVSHEDNFIAFSSQRQLRKTLAIMCSGIFEDRELTVDELVHLGRSREFIYLVIGRDRKAWNDFPVRRILQLPWFRGETSAPHPADYPVQQPPAFRPATSVPHVGARQKTSQQHPVAQPSRGSSESGTVSPISRSRSSGLNPDAAPYVPAQGGHVAAVIPQARLWSPLNPSPLDHLVVPPAAQPLTVDDEKLKGIIRKLRAVAPLDMETANLVSRIHEKDAQIKPRPHDRTPYGPPADRYPDFHSWCPFYKSYAQGLRHRGWNELMRIHPDDDQSGVCIGRKIPSSHLGRPVDRWQRLDLTLCRIIVRETDGDENYRKRLYREVTTLKRLNHTNIVDYYDHFVANVNVNGHIPAGRKFTNDSRTPDPNQQLVLITEYADAGNLLLEMMRYPNMLIPDPGCLYYARQILEAVDHMHRHHVCHNNIGKETILLKYLTHGRKKILISDFDCCKNFTTADEPGSRVKADCVRAVKAIKSIAIGRDAFAEDEYHPRLSPRRYLANVSRLLNRAGRHYYFIEFVREQEDEPSPTIADMLSKRWFTEELACVAPVPAPRR